ncbi:MAG: hypothetical protein R3E53_16375 [Myxococcota bacterium]
MIRVTNVMPGMIGTNFARNYDPAFVQGIVKSVGLEVEVKPGEHLPDEAFEWPGALRQVMGQPRTSPTRCSSS